VEEETQDAGREGIVLHPEVPSLSRKLVLLDFCDVWDRGRHTAQSFSAKLSWTLYLETSSRTTK
jgi:hypothetical protein